MADVLLRAVRAHIARPVDDVVAIIGTRRYRVGAHHLRRYVDDARRELGAGELRWNAGRDRLRLQVAEDVRRQREAVGGAPTDAETRKLANSAPVREAVDAVWAPLTAPGLLGLLYSDATFLARCAPSLDAREQALLAWPVGRSRRRQSWSGPDRVLLDELTGILDGTASYVHVVVDEAQDLSAMQCRAVSRRSPLGSLTVLGDLAQATTPWAPGSWPATLAHLGRPEARIRPLTIGYRVPGAVLDVANRLLVHIAPDLPPATSVRAGSYPVGYQPRSELADAVRRCAEFDGSIGVIVADPGVAVTLAELRRAGLDAVHVADDTEDDADTEPDATDTDTDDTADLTAVIADRAQTARIVVVPASEAKGLEFDSVVVVEPANIVDTEAARLNGLRRLYVVLTRAVSRLVVVHDKPLPAELGSAATDQRPA
jgi:hypothetical protein